MYVVTLTDVVRASFTPRLAPLGNFLSNCHKSQSLRVKLKVNLRAARAYGTVVHGFHRSTLITNHNGHNLLYLTRGLHRSPHCAGSRDKFVMTSYP